MRSRPLTSLSAIFLAAGLAFTGCSTGDDSNSDGSTAADGKTGSLKLNLASADMPDDADSILVRGFDESGALVFGPQALEIGGDQTPAFDVPTTTTILDISVLQDGVTVATYHARLTSVPDSHVLTVAIETGPTGPTGADGDTGASGSHGPTGSQGDSGVAGDAGPLGDAGDAGPEGDAGTAGDAGPLLGDAGDAGAEGDAGPKGDAGSEGATCAQGDERPDHASK